MDDNKLSHIDPNVVTDIFNVLKETCGDIVVSRRNKNSSLGTNITIRDDIKVEVDMKNKLEELFEMFGEDVSEKSSTPAAKHICNMDIDSK